MPPNDQTRGDDQETKPAGWMGSTQSFPTTPQSPSFFEHTDQNGFELAASIQVFDAENLPIKFGNYTLIEVIGEGGAGIVFKATPNPDQPTAKEYDFVAVKLIRPEIMASPKAAKRFEKESRLHAEVNSPYVTQHLEFGCELGVHYLVSEFVEGVGLDQVIHQLKTFPVKQSLRVVTDILKALAALHEMDVIHRDVKPGNVIASFRDGKVPTDDPTFDDYVIAKLTDFGLARHIEQSESLAMTRQKTMLGTPLYMAPEQYFESRTVDARADIYSVGVTLYQMLAGKLPFITDEAVELAEMHRVERPRPLTLVREETSEAVNNIVMKALEKEPSLRYQNASEMLADIQRAMNNEPTSLRLYPETPDKLHASVKSYDFEWTLDATAKQLWPLVSDTDRVNQAIGLPVPKFHYDHSGSERKILADANFNGMKVRWREHPFQWIVEREMSILREFSSGPFEWVTSTVELFPLAGSRTRLSHRFQVKPRGILGKLLTPFQFNFMTKRSLDRVYSRLEQLANDDSCRYACDFSFSKPTRLSSLQLKNLAQRSEQLASKISNRPLAKEFSKLLQAVAQPFAARIRPIPLAEKLECSVEESLRICLNSVEVGLLNMYWDIICPICRVSSGKASSLSRIQAHGHCEVCNLDFEIEFSKSVEVVFSAHPEIRPTEQKTYCIGGPYHAPHVLAQNRLLATQFVDIGTSLTQGSYEVCGPQIAEPAEIKVNDQAVASRAEVAVGVPSAPALPDLRSGSTCIHIENQSNIEILVRLEQTTGQSESMTASTACQHPLFKKLFPSEVIAPENLVDLSNVYLLAIKHLNSDALIDQVGDIQVRNYWTELQNKFPVDTEGCEIIECTHDSLMVSFGLIEHLLGVLNSIFTEKSDDGIPISECCFAINSGEVMTGGQANQPVAFGKTIRRTSQMLTKASVHSLVLHGGLLSAIAANHSAAYQQLLLRFNKSQKSQSGALVRLVRDKE